MMKPSNQLVLDLIKRLMIPRYPLSFIVGVLLFVRILFFKEINFPQSFNEVVSVFLILNLFFFVFLCEEKLTNLSERFLGVLASALGLGLVYYFWTSQVMNREIWVQIPLLLGTIICFGGGSTGGDIGIWRWQNSLVKTLLEAILVGLAFIASIFAVCFIIYFVFTYEFSDVFLKTVAKVGVTLVPITAFLIRIPTERDLYSRFREGLLRYFLLPLWAVYLLLLNIYALKIFVHRSLPQGMVSVPISFALTAYIILWWGSLPFQDSRKITWLSSPRVQNVINILHIPLLLLMALAIGKRLMDYGLSQHRYYLCLAWVFFAGSISMASLKKLTGKSLAILLFWALLASLIKV